MNNLGVVGDVLLMIMNFVESNFDVVKGYFNEDIFRKIFGFMEFRNFYVRENVMMLVYVIVKIYLEFFDKYRVWIVEEFGK